MALLENYYEILEVSPDADSNSIRHTYIKKARQFHPDVLRGMPENLLVQAEFRMKEINKAYEILGNPERRAAYHARWLKSKGIPRPIIENTHLRFQDADPNSSHSGYFVLRNDGGPYSRIDITSAAPWIHIKNRSPIHKTSELPARIEVAVRGSDWNRDYKASILVRLDDQATEVDVELSTRAKPESGIKGSRVIIGEFDGELLEKEVRKAKIKHQGASTSTLLKSRQPADLALYTHLGKVFGAITGMSLGLLYTVLIALQGASGLSRWPVLGTVVGILGGAYVAIVLLPLGLLAGMALGKIVGYVIWKIQKAIQGR